MRIPALVVAILLLVSIARADAPHRDDAELVHVKELEAKLEYEEALTLVEKIIARGGADRDKLVELHFLAGKLAAGLDRVDVAQEHFARVLSLRPGSSLPDGTSPKITMPFDAARGQTSPLRITVDTHSTPPTAVIEADTTHIVASTKALQDGFFYDVIAFDTYGNIVWKERVHGTEHVEPFPKQPEEHRPLYKQQLFWASGILVFGGFAGYSAWRFKVAQDQWDDYKAAGTHDYSELVDIEHRGHRWAAATYTGIGAAAVCALLVVLNAPRGSMVFAAPDSVSVGVNGRF